MCALARVVCDPHCPVRRSLDVVGCKWTLLIIRNLLASPRRFGELLFTVGDVGPKVLTERLRAIEGEGILTRTVFPEAPLRVEYALTDRGHALHPVIDALATWGNHLAAEMTSNRPNRTNLGGVGLAVANAWPGSTEARNHPPTGQLRGDGREPMPPRRPVLCADWRPRLNVPLQHWVVRRDPIRSAQPGSRRARASSRLTRPDL